MRYQGNRPVVSHCMVSSLFGSTTNTNLVLSSGQLFSFHMVRHKQCIISTATDPTSFSISIDKNRCNFGFYRFLVFSSRVQPHIATIPVPDLIVLSWLLKCILGHWHRASHSIVSSVFTSSPSQSKSIATDFSY